jgi:hypothetical protein
MYCHSAGSANFFLALHTLDRRPYKFAVVCVELLATHQQILFIFIGQWDAQPKRWVPFRAKAV